LIISHRKPDGGVSPFENKEEEQEGQEDHALEACAQDILRAIADKDFKHLALALRAAFDVLESEPHEEAEHDSPSPHSYDAQNKLAAKERDKG
jgi:hypothetical protein